MIKQPRGYHGRLCCIPIRERLMASIARTESGCWEWTRPLRKDGYGEIGFEARVQLAHRVSWILHRGPITSDECVLHKCDNRRCINPDHLFLGDRPANTRDAMQKGRILSGEKVPTSRLTEKDVREIRSSILSDRQLAERFGVSQTTINDARHRRTWRHLEAVGM